MSFEEFSKEFEKKIMEKVQEPDKVHFMEVNKNNGVLLHGISIFRNSGNVSPTVYEEGFFQKYEGGESMEALVDIFFEVMKKTPVHLDSILDSFKDFEKIKEKIQYKIVNTERNKELLKSIPHIDFMNLSICFYVFVQNDVIGNGTILVTEEHTKLWNTNTKDLFSLACENTPRNLPVLKMNLSDYISEALDAQVPECRDTIIMTNAQKYLGAISLFYPGQLEECGKQFGGSYYILPSSIHEMILVKDMEAEENLLIDMLISVNQTAVAKEEFLSDSPYYYDYSTKKLKRIVMQK